MAIKVTLVRKLRGAGLILLALLFTTIANLASTKSAQAGTIFPDSVMGNWQINANGYRASVLIVEWRLHQDIPPEPYGVWTNPDGTLETLSNISYDWKSSTLRFRRPLGARSQWYFATTSNGVLTGRFGDGSNTGAPAETSSSYQFHVTGWNETLANQSIVPRVWDVTINDEYKAKIRIDRADAGGTGTPTRFVGRMKIYATNSGRYRGEEPEYDLNVTQYSGSTLSFSRRLGTGTVQTFSGSVSGRAIRGDFYSGGTWWGYFSGERAEVLSYGLTNKTAAARAEWEQKTRTILRNLVMAGNPRPSGYRITQDRIATLEGPATGQSAFRDDDSARFPRNTNVRELTFEYDIPSRYSATPMRRRIHGFLAVPTTPMPPGGFPILLAVNGHGGSGWQMMNPMSNGIYYYGDTFARRGYVVFAMDIGHHADADARGLYGTIPGSTDDAHGMPFAQAIKSSGFDSDFEEDGERAWDGMQMISWLLTRSDINPNKVIVTGLSMGGEVSMYIGALDPRVTAVIASGYSPDMDVMHNLGNHGCYKWALANIREYVSISDFYSLVAPRTLIIQSGAVDPTFSYSAMVARFAADKQVVRRVRTAYVDGGVNRFRHILHDNEHRWRFGIGGPFAQTGMNEPSVSEPRWIDDLDWQSDRTTRRIDNDLQILLNRLSGW